MPEERLDSGEFRPFLRSFPHTASVGKLQPDAQTELGVRIDGNYV